MSCLPHFVDTAVSVNDAAIKSNSIGVRSGRAWFQENITIPVRNRAQARSRTFIIGRIVS
jgi:hypothetical protein